jgi:DNA-binding transcriptional LysR family regulator
VQQWNAMDKLKAITCFVRIVDRGSLTAAAEDLGLSLPSMVRTLAALERELGVTLLNRTTRRIHLTDAGREYLERCRMILGQIQEADAALHSRRAEPHGRLAVTASVLFGARYVAPLVSEFVLRHSQVMAELLLVDRIVNLVEEGMDAGVRIGHLGDSSLVAMRLGAVRRVICASPAYLREQGVPRHPEEVSAHRCVRLTGLAPLSEWTFPSSTRKVAISSVLTCNQPEVAIEACARGLGLGQFLSYMVAPLVQAGRLTYVLEDFEPDRLPIHVVYPHSRVVSPTVRAFAELCVKRLRPMRFE